MAVSRTRLLLRFYKPLKGHGQDVFQQKFGVLHRKHAVWEYQHKKMDPKPYPEAAKNDYFGLTTLWNVIPSKKGILMKKAEHWGWPHRDPPPTGLRRSREFYPYFMEKYFPDVRCKLLLDSVLNNETTRPTFIFPSDMSKAEIHSYLKNIHGFDNIQRIEVKNLKGRRYKNEIGAIRTLPDQKYATIRLDAPVQVEYKQVKASEDVKE